MLSSKLRSRALGLTYNLYMTLDTMHTFEVTATEVAGKVFVRCYSVPSKVFPTTEHLLALFAVMVMLFIVILYHSLGAPNVAA